MPSPLSGAAVPLDTWPLIRDLVCGAGRSMEVQSFCALGMLETGHFALLAASQAAWRICLWR